MIRSPPRSPLGSSTGSSAKNTPIRSNRIHGGSTSPPIRSTSNRRAGSPVREGHTMSTTTATSLLQDELHGGGGVVLLGTRSTASLDISSSSNASSVGGRPNTNTIRARSEPLPASPQNAYGYSSRIRASWLARPSLKEWGSSNHSATPWMTTSTRASDATNETINLKTSERNGDGLGTPVGGVGGNGVLNWLSGRLSMMGLSRASSNALRPEDLFGLQDMDVSHFLYNYSPSDILDSDGEVSEVEEDDDDKMLWGSVSGFLNQRAETFRNNVDTILSVHGNNGDGGGDDGACAVRNSEHEIYFMNPQEMIIDDNLSPATTENNEHHKITTAGDRRGRARVVNNNNGGGPFSTFRKNMISITKRVVPGGSGGGTTPSSTHDTTTTTTRTTATAPPRHRRASSLTDLYNFHDAESRGSSHGGVIDASNPQDHNNGHSLLKLKTHFTRNMNTIAETIREGGEIDIHVEDNEYAFPNRTTTFQRNMDVIARRISETRDQLSEESERGVTEFLKCRVNTLRRNVDLAQYFSKVGTDNFGKNINFIGTSVRGELSSYSRHSFNKNMDFAKEAANAIARDMDDASNKSVTFAATQCGDSSQTVSTNPQENSQHP